MFKAGSTYKAKLVEAGLQETKAGQPQAWMKFHVIAEDGTTEEFYWSGGFSNAKAQELTMKALLTAGFIGKDVEDLNKPTAFVPADVTVEMEDFKGKLKIKWVNGKKEKTAYKGATPKLAGAFAKMRQEMGIKATDEIPW